MTSEDNSEKGLSTGEQVLFIKSFLEKKGTKYITWINEISKKYISIDNIFSLQYLDFLKTELPNDFFLNISLEINEKYLICKEYEETANSED